MPVSKLLPASLKRHSAVLNARARSRFGPERERERERGKMDLFWE